MIEGRLLKRAKLNLNRLLDPIYDYPKIFDHGNDWPGDFPGRALLALTSLYQTFEGYAKEQSAIMERIQRIFSHLEENLNEHKFFGQEFNPNYINEQQLSGNSWYIRALCKYYEIIKDEKIIKHLKTIKDKFLIPLSSEYKTYPVEERSLDGDVCGHSFENKTSNWLLSSDVGCAFILLDGYVSCYELLKDEELKKAIEYVIEQYLKIDFLSLKCQTHATLTCARAILRFYLVTKEEKYLASVEDIFNKYIKYGMTDEYENMNWFNRENTWTEPCCVIDSFILSKHLFLITNKFEYLKLYNRIYLNGIRTFQRNNGGAGCSLVVRNKQRVLKQWLYEAFFCCTMRCGEGFYELSKSIIKKDDEYHLLIPQSFRNEDVNLKIDLYEEKVFEVEFLKPGSLVVYVPDGFKSDYKVINNELKLIANESKKIKIPFELDINKVGQIYLLGDMVLSQKDKHITRIYEINGQKYSVIFDSSTISEEEMATIEQKL